MTELFGQISEKLIAGQVDDVVKLTQEAVDSGSGASDILQNGLLAGMDVVGQRFKANEMFIPEVLRPTRLSPEPGSAAARLGSNAVFHGIAAHKYDDIRLAEFGSAPGEAVT